MTKKLTLTKLDKKIDTLYSRYIRLSYAFERDGVLVNECFTCGQVKPIKEMHNGHYLTRRFKKLKYYERNTHPQCPGCNKWGNGEPQIYRNNLISVYGEAEVKWMLDKYIEWKANKLKPPTRAELEFKLLEYQDKVAKLEAKHGKWSTL